MPQAIQNPERKQSLRRTLRQRRVALGGTGRAEASARICKTLMAQTFVQNARSVFAYLGNDEEVVLDSLIEQLLRTGIVVAVPAITGPGSMRPARVVDLAQTTVSGMGIRTPEPRTFIEVEFDLVLAPGVGFSRQGGRLGYGAGFYDRWLTTQTGAFKVGVAFDAQVVEDIPLDPHDIAMDALVTETGFSPAT